MKNLWNLLTAVQPQKWPTARLESISELQIERQAGQIKPEAFDRLQLFFARIKFHFVVQFLKVYLKYLFEKEWKATVELYSPWQSCPLHASFFRNKWRCRLLIELGSQVFFLQNRKVDALIMPFKTSLICHNIVSASVKQTKIWIKASFPVPGSFKDRN